eukprot:COSAG01_NODE_44746_length_416_cov_0.599369_1_plen_55_part_10
MENFVEQPYINQVPITLDFIVCDLDIGCDLLLGQPFLRHYHALIDARREHNSQRT